VSKKLTESRYVMFDSDRMLQQARECAAEVHETADAAGMFPGTKAAIMLAGAFRALDAAVKAGRPPTEWSNEATQGNCTEQDNMSNKNAIRVDVEDGEMYLSRDSDGSIRWVYTWTDKDYTVRAISTVFEDEGWRAFVKAVNSI
jgi:hypothetical protein